jgi:hypothetical protein
MNRDKKGRFSKSPLKTFVILAVVVFLIVAGFSIFNSRFMAWADENVHAESYVATTTEPTRLQQTQSLIDSLTEQRKGDQSFIQETKKEEAELQARREAQARIDALTIVKTQLDMEIDALSKTNIN